MEGFSQYLGEAILDGDSIQRVRWASRIFNNLLIIYWNHRRMLKSAPTRSKIALADILNRTSRPAHLSPSSPLDPKNLLARPPPIPLNRKSSNKGPSDLPLTSKTARSTYHHLLTSNSSFSRSTHLTPDRTKNNHSYTTPIKPRPPQHQENTPSSDAPENKTEYAPAQSDRSSRALKTIVFRESTNTKEDTGLLRQTVSNSNFLKNNVGTPPSQIRLFAYLRKNKKQKTIHEDASFHKRIQSKYSPAFPPAQEDYTQDFKPRIFSTTHSRENSNYHAENDNFVQATAASPFLAGLEALTFKSRGGTSSQFTPRGSHDKLALSINLRKDKSMNQTDPIGSFFPLSRDSLRTSVKSKDSTSPPLKLQDFQLGSCKGQGRFGKVYPAVHKVSGCLVAIKQIKKEEIRLMLDQFVQQLKINLFVDHPNIVKMYGFFNDRTYCYIMMEYMEEGSLYKVIKTQKKMKEEETARKLYEICDAVSYLHAEDVLHRDIKPENIVISNGVCKLCDFGWATFSKERRNTYCGTLDYVCPEILQGQSYDSFVDIWAIGVLAYEMLTGKAPFYHISRKETMKSIMNCDFSFPAEMTVSAKLFIKKALQKCPDQRFTIESLFKDRFLSSCNPMG